MHITGVHINYYFVCKRELWLFDRGIRMEQTSDLVYTGKVVDESSYERKEKGIDIDGAINIDWIDTTSGIIHEVKKSDSMEKAHEMQVQYYIWYLKQKGVEGITGELDYPLLKQKTKVELTAEKEKELVAAIKAIEEVLVKSEPPERISKKFCKTCSYYDLCWANM